MFHVTRDIHAFMKVSTSVLQVFEYVFHETLYEFFLRPFFKFLRNLLTHFLYRPIAASEPLSFIKRALYPYILDG